MTKGRFFLTHASKRTVPFVTLCLLKKNLWNAGNSVIIEISKQSFLLTGIRNRSVFQFMKSFEIPAFQNHIVRQDNSILRNCQTLQEYAKFIASIRDNSRTNTVEDAVRKAVDDCIKQGVLKEFLTKHKAQVIRMSIYEYDEEKQRRLDRADGREEGIELGEIKQQVILIKKKMQKGKSLDIIADELETAVDDIKSIYDVIVSLPADTDPGEIAEKICPIVEI